MNKADHLWPQVIYVHIAYIILTQLSESSTGILESFSFKLGTHFI